MRAYLSAFRMRRRLEVQTARLRACAQLAEGRRHRLDALASRLTRAGARLTARDQGRLAVLTRALEAVNPNAVLSRGYAVIRRDGEAVSSAAALRPDDLIDIRMRDGGARARVLDAGKEIR